MSQSADIAWGHRMLPTLVRIRSGVNDERKRNVEAIRDLLGDGSQDSYYWSGYTAGLKAAIQAIEAEDKV